MEKTSLIKLLGVASSSSSARAFLVSFYCKPTKEMTDSTNRLQNSGAYNAMKLDMYESQFFKICNQEKNIDANTGEM